MAKVGEYISDRCAGWRSSGQGRQLIPGGEVSAGSSSLFIFVSCQECKGEFVRGVAQRSALHSRDYFHLYNVHMRIIHALILYDNCVCRYILQ